MYDFARIGNTSTVRLLNLQVAIDYLVSPPCRHGEGKSWLTWGTQVGKQKWDRKQIRAF